MISIVKIIFIDFELTILQEFYLIIRPYYN